MTSGEIWEWGVSPSNTLPPSHPDKEAGEASVSRFNHDILCIIRSGKENIKDITRSYNELRDLDVNSEVISKKCNWLEKKGFLIQLSNAGHNRPTGFSLTEAGINAIGLPMSNKTKTITGQCSPTSSECSGSDIKSTDIVCAPSREKRISQTDIDILKIVKESGTITAKSISEQFYKISAEEKGGESRRTTINNRCRIMKERGYLRSGQSVKSGSVNKITNTWELTDAGAAAIAENKRNKAAEKCSYEEILESIDNGKEAAVAMETPAGEIRENVDEKKPIGGLHDICAVADAAIASIDKALIMLNNKSYSKAVKELKTAISYLEADKLVESAADLMNGDSAAKRMAADYLTAAAELLRAQSQEVAP